MDESVWQCIWCMKASPDKVCPQCGGECADRTKPHATHWSRKSIRSVECKICGRETTYDQMVTDVLCNGLGGSSSLVRED
jgi:hypothetical protein